MTINYNTLCHLKKKIGKWRTYNPRKWQRERKMLSEKWNLAIQTTVTFFVYIKA